MRIRSIKPEFWRSDDIAVLSREDRLLFIGLWSYVDDNGVGIDDERRIVADLFALDDDQKEVRDFIRDGLATLSRAFLLARYEVANRRYLFITGWDRHQRIDRPGKPRYPRPPETWTPPTSRNVDPQDVDTTPSRQSRDTPSPGSGNRGTEEQGTGEQGTGEQEHPPAARAEPADRFPDFWDAYPRRQDRRAAEKAWRAAVKRGADPDRVIAAARAYAAVPREPRFTKYPATWLNAGAYDDEPQPTGPLRIVNGGYQAWRNPADDSAYDEPFFPAQEAQ